MTSPKPNAAAKPRKPRATKPPKVIKQKVTFHLTGEAVRRVAIHAAMLGLDKSELIEDLVSRHLRRFVVHDHGEDGDQAEGGRGPELYQEDAEPTSRAA